MNRYNKIIRDPQSSVLVTLFFSIFITDLLLFLEKSEVFSIAKFNAIHRCTSKLPLILQSLENDVLIALNCFKLRFMILGNNGNNGI